MMLPKSENILAKTSNDVNIKKTRKVFLHKRGEKIKSIQRFQRLPYRVRPVDRRLKELKAETGSSIAKDTGNKKSDGFSECMQVSPIKFSPQNLSQNNPENSEKKSFNIRGYEQDDLAVVDMSLAAIISDEEDEQELDVNGNKVNEKETAASSSSSLNMSLVGIDDDHDSADGKRSLADGNECVTISSQIEEASISFENLSIILTDDEELEKREMDADSFGPASLKDKAKSSFKDGEKQYGSSQCLRVTLLSKNLKMSAQKDLKLDAETPLNLTKNYQDAKDGNVRLAEKFPENLVITKPSDSTIRVVCLQETKNRVLASDMTSKDAIYLQAKSSQKSSDPRSLSSSENASGFRKQAGKTQHSRQILSDSNVPYEPLKECDDLRELAKCKTTAYCVFGGKPRNVLELSRPNSYRRFQNFDFTRSTETDVLELYGRLPTSLPEDLEDTPICREDIKDFAAKSGKASDYDKYFSNNKNNRQM